ncbi:MAG: HesA/MoeB/ThiF family protein [Egibacteraceae bacterium]
MQDDHEGLVWKLLGLMDGTRTVDAIVTQMVRDHRGLDPGSVRAALAALSKAGFVEDAGAGIPESLSEHETERYATNIRYFAWVDDQPRESPYELQRRLKAARVTVLGLGGTGCAVAMSLVAAGVGAVRCVDHDVIEASNLSRQLLYTEQDIGSPKSEAAVRRLRRLNPHVAVEGMPLHVTRDLR